MEKSHVAYLLGGAALASAYFWLARPKTEKKEQKAMDVESEQYKMIKSEQLARIVKYFGEEKFSRMENSYVMVLGVGGVGSHVVNMLARSGVKRIKIVDFDRVSLSSLNRHSCAVRKDVGTSKVQCIKQYIGEILPHIQIEVVETYVTV
jgi:tRNA threonylcarbamoyladenosine dehydratase